MPFVLQWFWTSVLQPLFCPISTGGSCSHTYDCVIDLYQPWNSSTPVNKGDSWRNRVYMVHPKYPWSSCSFFHASWVWSSQNEPGGGVGMSVEKPEMSFDVQKGMYALHHSANQTSWRSARFFLYLLEDARAAAKKCLEVTSHTRAYDGNATKSVRVSAQKWLKGSPHTIAAPSK